MQAASLKEARAFHFVIHAHWYILKLFAKAPILEHMNRAVGSVGNRETE